MGSYSYWWLRSPGKDSNSAATINHDGSIDSYGYIVDHDNIGIRPALWIDFSNFESPNP